MLVASKDNNSKGQDEFSWSSENR